MKSTEPHIKLPPRKIRKVTETDTVHDAIDALCKIPGVRARRNNNVVLNDARGIPVKAGLGDGSPDIVGIITFGGNQSAVPDLVLFYAIAIPFGIEMKSETAYYNKARHGCTEEQLAWAESASLRGMPTTCACTVEACEQFVRTLISERVHTFR